MVNTPVTQRDFIKTTGFALAVSLSRPLCSMAHARELHAGFPIIDLHQDKLLYGSDCNDSLGRGPVCQGSETIKTVMELSANKEIRSKIFHRNASRLLKISC